MSFPSHVQSLINFNMLFSVHLLWLSSWFRIGILSAHFFQRCTCGTCWVATSIQMTCWSAYRAGPCHLPVVICVPCASNMATSSDPLLAVLVADTTISLESPGVPPSCPTGLNACSRCTCRAGKYKSLVDEASLTTLHSEITKCCAFSHNNSSRSICSSSSSSGERSGNSSIASETCWE